MTTLTITRGLPGAGKTTWALQYAAETGYLERLDRGQWPELPDPSIRALQRLLSGFAAKPANAAPKPMVPPLSASQLSSDHMDPQAIARLSGANFPNPRKDLT